MVWEKVWLEVAWAIRRVGDRAGEDQNTETVWGVTTHIEATGRYVKEGWGKGW
jgi:hypothetical protein